MSTTALEARVLKTFGTYKTAEGTKADLGVSWTDAAEIAKATGLPIATVAGVVGSLVKKGLVHSDHEPGKPDALCLLTEKGVDVLFDLPDVDFASETVAADWNSAGEATDALNAPIVEVDQEDAFVAALLKAGADEQVAKDMGNPFPGIICATLRDFACQWEGTRGTFIKTAQLAGFNKFTAATQWQRVLKEG